MPEVKLVLKSIILYFVVLFILICPVFAQNPLKLIPKELLSKNNLVCIFNENTLMSCVRTSLAYTINAEKKVDSTLKVILVISGKGYFQNPDDSFFKKYLKYDLLVKDVNNSLIKKYQSSTFMIDKELNIIQTYNSIEMAFKNINKTKIVFDKFKYDEPIMNVRNSIIIKNRLYFDDLIQGKTYNIDLENISKFTSFDFFQHEFKIKNFETLPDLKEYYRSYWDNRYTVNPALLYSIYNGNEFQYAAYYYDSVGFNKKTSSLVSNMKMYVVNNKELKSISDSNIFDNENTIYFNRQLASISSNNELTLGTPDKVDFTWGNSVDQKKYFGRILNQTYSPYTNIANIDNNIYYLSEENSLLCKLNFTNGDIDVVDTLINSELSSSLFYRNRIKSQDLNKGLISSNSSLTGLFAINNQIIVSSTNNSVEQAYSLYIFDKDLNFVKRVAPDFSYYEKNISACHFVGIYENNYLFLVYSDFDGWLLAKTSCSQY